MSSSKNEFIVGCLVGGILGAVAAMFVPKKFLSGAFSQISQKGVRGHLHAKGHVNSTSHSDPNQHKVRKPRASRTTRSKSTATRKGSLKKAAKDA